MLFRQLFKDSLKLISGQGAVFALGLISAVIIARLLGPEGRGLQSWVVTLAAIGVHLGLLGVDVVNRQRVGADPSRAPAMFGTTLLLAAISTTILLPVLFIFGLTQPLGQAHPDVLLLGLSALPFALLTMTLGALLIALGGVGETTLNIVWAKVALLLLVVLFALDGELSVLGVMGAHLIAPIVGLAWLIWRLRKRVKKIVLDVPDLKKLGRFLTGAYGAGLGIFLMQKVDLVMLGSIAGAAPTGQYSVATTLIDALYVLPGVPVYLALSKLSKLEEGAFKRTVRWLRLALAGTLALMVAVLWFAAPWGIPLLFGIEFLPSVTLFHWLLPALVLFSLLNLEQTLLAAKAGQGWILAFGPLVGLVLNIVLNSMFIPAYGAVGAAWASIAAYGAAWLCALSVAYAKRNALPQ